MSKTSKKIILIIIEILLYICKENKRTIFSKNYKNNNFRIFNIIKLNLYDIIYKTFNKNITYIDTLFFYGSKKIRFGNFIISLNNAIIFCEFLCCKRIIVESFSNIYIYKKIIYSKYNLTIEPNNNNFTFSNNSLIVNANFFFYYLNFKIIGNVNRLYIFRNEILSNLPKIKINPNDLYIYARGGDIFKIANHSSRFYAQPPLCFYENILYKFNFRKIRIISEDNLNPIVSKLLEKFNYIKYNKNSIKLDISYLANSYNIVSGKSSYIVSIIKLNDNLKFLWEYDLYILSERYKHLHYSVYSFSFNYIIYRMNVSKSYEKLMFPFMNSEKQKGAMINEKCNKNFIIIPPRIS